MMKKLAVLFFIFTALSMGAVFAQDDEGKPNDPNVNPRANACFEGGLWEGKCHTTDADEDGDIDQQDINWMWRCGWYVIRADQGLLQAGEYPSECYTPYVAPVIPDVQEDSPIKGCIGVIGPVGPVGPSSILDIFDPCDPCSLLIPCGCLTPALPSSIASFEPVRGFESVAGLPRSPKTAC